MFLVCGEALFDLFPGGSDSSNLIYDATPGGSPFNVAIGLARLAVPCGLLAGVSVDPLGERLFTELKRNNVNTDYLVRSNRKTTLSLVGLDANRVPAYSFYGTDSADCMVQKEDLPTIGDDIIGIHFGSFSTVVEPVGTAFKAVAEKNRTKFISFDPNVRTTIEPDLDIWRRSVRFYSSVADVIKISLEDYEILYPEGNVEQTVNEWLASGVQLVVITDGAEKVTAWTKKHERVQISPPRVKVEDTVGAGDSFQAALLSRIVENKDIRAFVCSLDEQQIKKMMNFSSRAAAITCSRRGADLPLLEEL